jgi:hypothetical protein
MGAEVWGTGFGQANPVVAVLTAAFGGKTDKEGVVFKQLCCCIGMGIVVVVVNMVVKRPA